MKPQQKKSPRRFNGNGNGNGNGNSNPNRHRDHRRHRSPVTVVEYDEMNDSFESDMPGPGNLEMYLAEQMRTLIRARQAQDQALREIRSLGEQLTVGDAPVRVREQYNQALRNWQESRRDGVNARQKLLVAMTDRGALDRH